MGFGSEDRDLLIIGLVILFVAFICVLGGRVLSWTTPPRYDTGVTTNAAEVSYGSGYPAGTYVGHDWTVQPF